MATSESGARGERKSPTIVASAKRHRGMRRIAASGDSIDIQDNLAGAYEG